MQVIVDKHTVTIVKNEIVNEGEYNIHKCEFDFDEEYNGLVQKAVFTLNDGTSYLETIVNNECNIPIEVLEEGVLKIGVYAYETNNDELVLRYSPSPDIIHVFDGSYVKDAQNTEPITPTDKEQIEQAITDLQNDVTDLEESKQDTLVSGENIKTINGESVLGSGNIEIDLSNYYNKQEIDQSQASQNANISKNTDDIATLNNNLTNYSLITETGSQIVLNVNSSNYQMTAILKDKNGNVIYTSNVIDLPIESMIIDIDYDSATKEIVFTLQNGTTLRVSVADLVSGLVSTDELNTILANYYTKTEIDNLLSGKVDTTTYTQGQATQDANIEENASNIDWLQTLVNQMPHVSGQGTDLTLQDVLNYRLMKFLPQGVSSQDGEPTPTTPIPVKSVTGENVLKISNSDNTETQTYQLSLGNIELNSSPDGTIRDGIVGKPNEWYKREYIGKVVLDGSESGWINEGGGAPYTINIPGALITTSNNELPNVLVDRFKRVAFNSNWNNYNSLVAPGTATVANQTKLKFRYTDISGLNSWKQWLSENNVTVYYLKAQYTDIPITDTTLINQLNDIYNNAHSYNGTTNITTTYESGNEQMYLDVEALKNVWEVTE